MRQSEFLGILGQLSKLNPTQKELILSRLALGLGGQQGNLASMLQKPQTCPRCGCPHLGSWGLRKGLGRYRCRSCHSVFTALSQSPLSGLYHREKWLQYAGCLLDGRTIRKAAKECGICNTVAFRWRHRFLALIDSMKPLVLKGLVEVDETLFLDSKKGDRHLGRHPRKRGGKAQKPGRSAEQVTVLVARDRHGVTTDFILPQFNAEAVSGVLGPVIAPDALLLTDGSPVLASFATQKGLLHQSINASAGEKVLFNTFHVQNVNAYHSRLKEWMRRFHGVSTKWLSRYLGWWRMLDGNQSILTPGELLRYALS